MKKIVPLALLSLLFAASAAFGETHPLVLQTDFGLKDGAVSAMKGVSYQVDHALPIFDLTHEIPAYNIWEAAFRLKQTVPYWPAGSVIVSVVDPGVGTDRKSVVARLKTGQLIVTPDNGTLTFLAEKPGIDELREIDEKTNRLPGSEKSYTFHGRDVYAYTGARLASGKITYEQVGPKLEKAPIAISYTQPDLQNGLATGNIPILDVQYGNIWTNLGDDFFQKLTPKKGELFHVKIAEKGTVKYEGDMPYASSFGDVPTGAPLLYLNSLLEVSFALNEDSFAAKKGVSSGPDWSVEVSRAKVP